MARAGAARVWVVGATWWRRLVDWAGAAFVVGLLLFCGSVYALALGGVHVAMVAPMGGTLLMVGWALLGLSAVLARRD